MRKFSAHVIRYRAFRVQTVAFYVGVVAGLAFMGFAIAARETGALVCAILGSLALGISVGAWAVGSRFKD